MTAPREVSTTDRPSAWGRIRVARVSSWRTAPAASARSARPSRQPGRVEPGALLHDEPAEVRVAADLGPQLRPRHHVRLHAHPAHRVDRAVEGGRVRGRRREHEVAGALELGVDGGRAQALDVLERLDRLAVEDLGALDAVEPPERGQRLLEPRVAEAAVAGRGAPADPLGLEQDDARAQLGDGSSDYDEMFPIHGPEQADTDGDGFAGQAGQRRRTRTPARPSSTTPSATTTARRSRTPTS